MTTLLLEKGANLEAKNATGSTVLHLVASQATDSADDDKDLETLLLKRGANPLARDSSGCIPLHLVFNRPGCVLTKHCL